MPKRKVAKSISGSRSSRKRRSVIDAPRALHEGASPVALAQRVDRVAFEPREVVEHALGAEDDVRLAEIDAVEREAGHGVLNYTRQLVRRALRWVRGVFNG